MAASIELKTCPICQEEIRDPRVLPCIHSFCLECLERYCRNENKLPGDDVPCPVCRQEFQIPKNGVAGLTVRTHNKEPAPSAMSKVCSYEDEIEQITSHFESFRELADQVKAEKSKMHKNVKAVEQKIKNKGEEVKRLIDRQVSDLLRELQSMKSTAEKEIKSHADNADLVLTELQSFWRLRCSQGDTPDVRARATELLQKHAIPGEYHAPSYVFTPVNSEKFSHTNLIGHVITGTVSSLLLTYFAAH